MKANVYASLMNLDPRSKTWAIPQYNCPTGNCTWDPVDVLSADHSCTDLTQELQLYCNNSESRPGLGGINTNCKLSLPTGPHVRFRSNSGFGTLFTSATYLGDAPKPNNTKSFPLARIRYIRATGIDMLDGALKIHLSNATKWIAGECSLNLCTRRISSTVTNGEYREVEHDVHDHSTTWSKWMDWSQKTNTSFLLSPNGQIEFKGWNTYEGGDSMYVAFQPPPWPNNSTTETRRTFGVSWFAAVSITSFFYDLFEGSVATSSDTFGFYARNKGLFGNFRGAAVGATQDILQSIVYGDLAGCDSGREPMDCALANTAKAVTKTFRDDAFIIYGRSSASMSLGKTLVEQVNIQIQWPWLVMPLLVWVLSTGLWLATIWSTWTRGIPMWRNNPLPLLFLYRPTNESAYFENGNSTSLAYTRRSKKILGQLHATKAVKEPRIE
jgi:hypothetical protein